MPPSMPPVSVFKDPDGWVWRWTCRNCQRSDWANRHPEALADAQRHVKAHRDFGFKR